MSDNQDIQPSGTSENSGDSTPEHPIVAAANHILNRIRDIEECGMIYPKLAEDRMFQELESVAENLVSLLNGGIDPKSPDHGLVVKGLLDASRKVHRIRSSNSAETLLSSLFLGIFSAYDAFTGDLLKALFELKPELFFKLGKNVSVVEVLRAPSIEIFKRDILEDYVDGFRRQGYIDQFDTLEKLFETTLRKFESWPKFVETSQRRNLIAHCSGVVSEQYISICKREQGLIYEAKTGDRLTVDRNYLIHTCQIVKEVALKLAQTLWRKALPGEIESADKHLITAGYEALQTESWDWAQTIGEFAIGQKNTANERNRLIALVNLMIALKFSGKEKELTAYISAQDWSAKDGEFRLAAAVLKGEFDEAARIMHMIGIRGEMLTKEAYHEWPLFREFRTSPQFLETYESIYGHPFINELEKEAKAEVDLIEGVREEASQSEEAPDTEPYSESQEAAEGQEPS